MAKIKTKEELEAGIAQVKNEIRQSENYVKQLLLKNHQQERKDRTRRLIERGAIVESLIAGAEGMTGEEIKAILVSALSGRTD